MDADESMVSGESGVKHDSDCEKCKKDWTKCGKCPVMMEWMKRRKKMSRYSAKGCVEVDADELEQLKRKAELYDMYKRQMRSTNFEKTEYRSVDQTGETYADGDGWRCSVCCNVWKDEHVSPRWKYCPHCGAKMEDDEEK